MGEVYNVHTTTDGKIHYYDTETGEHVYDPTISCTKSTGSSETINPPKMTGWICPVCGRGLSPYTSVCPCKGFIQGAWEVTC